MNCEVRIVSHPVRHSPPSISKLSSISLISQCSLVGQRPARDHERLRVSAPFLLRLRSLALSARSIDRGGGRAKRKESEQGRRRNGYRWRLDKEGESDTPFTIAPRADHSYTLNETLVARNHALGLNVQYRYSAFSFTG